MHTTSTARVFDRQLLPAVPDGDVPFWRVVLRGCSQCIFQTNEVTGALFLLAVLAFSWEQFVLMAIGAVIGPAVALALRADRVQIGRGLHGFNACLIALALGNYFERDASLWAAVVVLSIVTAVFTALAMRIVRFPVLAAPFIVVFWIFWPLAENVGLTKLLSPPLVDMDVFFMVASIRALGSVLFAGAIVAGVLILVGLLISNWRHAVLAVAAAMIAHTIALWFNVPGQAINSGLAGFNAVLAAVAVYALVTADIRVALLAAIVATALLPLFSGMGLVPLASGFVVTTWAVLVLGWFQRRFFDLAAEPVAVE